MARKHREGIPRPRGRRKASRSSGNLHPNPSTSATGNPVRPAVRPRAAGGWRGLPGPAGRNRVCGSSYLCRNTGFRRKPSVGELDAPSVPTYCST